MAKHKAPTNEDVRERWNGLFEALNHTEDLTCVVVSTSYIDYTLAALLKAHFIDSTLVDKLLDSTGDGALGDLMAKANVAYCLGLIPKEDRYSVEMIARIRNRFAHSVDGISFGDSQVEELCDELKSALLTAPPFDHLATIAEGGTKHPGRSRARFTMTAVMLCSTIAIAALSAEKRKGLTRVNEIESTDPASGIVVTRSTERRDS